MIKILSDRTIRGFKPRAVNGTVKGYEVIDRMFPGLTLRVLASGVKSWSLRYRISGRARRISRDSGPAPEEERRVGRLEPDFDRDQESGTGVHPLAGDLYAAALSPR